jgi:hypothetical protein
MTGFRGTLNFFLEVCVASGVAFARFAFREDGWCQCLVRQASPKGGQSTNMRPNWLVRPWAMPNGRVCLPGFVRRSTNRVVMTHNIANQKIKSEER